MKLKFIVLAVITLFLASCQSRDGDYSLFSTADDLALGEKISSQIENDPQNFPILDRTAHPKLYSHLEGILTKILNSDGIYHKEELAWKLNIIHNDTIYNAFCTPGGFIYMFTGLIRFVESEDELAGVIAHEVAYGDLRHSTDQLTKLYGLKILAGLLTDGDSELLAGIGVNMLGLKFSRGDETEADAFAVRYLSDTDYNPLAFADFFVRMNENGESMGPLQFLSTHPDPGNRVEKIKTEWQKAGSKKGKDHSASFNKLLRYLP